MSKYAAFEQVELANPEYGAAALLVISLHKGASSQLHTATPAGTKNRACFSNFAVRAPVQLCSSKGCGAQRQRQSEQCVITTVNEAVPNAHTPWRNSAEHANFSDGKQQHHCLRCNLKITRQKGFGSGELQLETKKAPPTCESPQERHAWFLEAR
eukprot:1149967-Pelagomonas_calceolata.AAC.2